MSKFKPIDFWTWIEANRCEPSCSCRGVGWTEKFSGIKDGAEHVSLAACPLAEKRYEAQVEVDRERWAKLREAPA